MSLISNLSDVVQAIGNRLKEHTSQIGSLPTLTTTAKTSLVAAINEVRSAAASATGIDDGVTGSTTTWSSGKIDSEIDARKPTWGSLTGKPSTFPPTIGSTASTAKAGNWTPTWSDVTAKPSFAAVATSGSYADLTGVIPSSALPPLAIKETFTVASQSEMLALTAQRGDMAIRTDSGHVYVLTADTPATLSAWIEIVGPAAVVSVNGKTGTVSLAKGDIGLGNVDNTSDANKPISAATATALAGKAVLGTTPGTAVDNARIGDTDTDFVAILTAALA